VGLIFVRSSGSPLEGKELCLVVHDDPASEPPMNWRRSRMASDAGLNFAKAPPFTEVARDLLGWSYCGTKASRALIVLKYCGDVLHPFG
jgi:hypothetical protein